MRRDSLLRCTFVILAAFSCGRQDAPADAIYTGTIITMNAARPTAEALAVRNGRILAVGATGDVMRHRGARTRVVALQDDALLPGFIDAHSHLAYVAERAAEVNLSPAPMGAITSIADLQGALRSALPVAQATGQRSLVGSGYDHTRVAEQRRLTRQDLDEVSRTVPIVVNHFSGHMRVANTRALTEAGITNVTPDPPGGRLRRDSRGALTGELEETAQALLDAVLSASGSADSVATARQADDLLDAAAKSYAAAGYTTAMEAWGTGPRLDRLKRASAAGRLAIDVVAFPHYADASPSAPDGYSRTYRQHFRIGGVKLNLDGGSPGRTAYLREPYHEQLSGEQGYRGYPRFADQGALNELVTRYYTKGIPVVLHALGDAAVDQAIAAVTAAERAEPGNDRRTQLVHLQQVQEDQLDSLTRLQVTLSFQVAHVYYFGDLHYTKIFGPDRAARLTPIRSALDRGLSVTIHTDAPVHPVDQMTLIWIAVNRQSASGRVLGAVQRVTVLEALAASTIGAAHQLFEEHEKGSLEPGKFADFVILDRNPLAIPAESLRNVRVVETIKEGLLADIDEP